MFGLGALLGKSGIDKIIDGATRGFDALKYTAEEKAHEAADREKQQAEINFRAQGQVVEWIKAMQPAARARRIIACVVVSIWALTMVVTLAFTMAAPWTDTYHDRILESAAAARETLESTDELFYIILLFYFGSPTVMPAIQGFLAKRLGSGRQDAEQT